MAGFRGVARRTDRRTSRRQMAMMQGGSEPEGDVPPEQEVADNSIISTNWKNWLSSMRRASSQMRNFKPRKKSCWDIEKLD